MQIQLRTALLVLVFLFTDARAQDSIQVGNIELDAPTICCLGFAVPILDGDDDYDATAMLEYRRAGDLGWQTGLPLLRVRPETIGTTESTPPESFAPGEQFAGSVLHLIPDTAYDLRVTVNDPDGGSAVLTAVATTRSLPLNEPANPNLIAVTNASELGVALAEAKPGDVIELAEGTYNTGLSISTSGTPENPIMIRGVDRDTVFIDATGISTGVTVTGSNVYVQELTVIGSNWGARLDGSDNIVVRRVRFTAVGNGIDAQQDSAGPREGYYLCDNILEGPFTWPDVGVSSVEGIVITGHGHTVCHNTVSGFGDAVGLGRFTSIPNRAIDFYGNDVRWSRDDGIELDYSQRNVRAFRNRVANAIHGVSVQPGWGGPMYILHNVLVNTAASPLKFNNSPTGLLVYHNTGVRTFGASQYIAANSAWGQIGYSAGGVWAWVANFDVANNIFVGPGQPALFTSDIILGAIDYNGWYPDGNFVFEDEFDDLADVKATSPFEANGHILAQPIFENAPVFGADYATLVTDAEVAITTNSNAVDTGRILPNINDGYIGSGPDLGAWERGQSIPAYGVRPLEPAEPQLDTDGDGVPDVADEDDDNDLLSDDDELQIYGTNPLKADTDGDGLKDGFEIENGFDPLDGEDCPERLCPRGSSVLRLLILLEQERQLRR